jgi:hypothetical protein
MPKKLVKRTAEVETTTQNKKQKRSKPEVKRDDIQELVKNTIKTELEKLIKTGEIRCENHHKIPTTNQPEADVLVVPSTSAEAVPETQSIQEAINAVLNSNNGESNYQPQDCYFDLPLGATLCNKIKNKIMLGEYVDLVSLLYPSQDNLTIQLQPNNPTTISMSPSSKKQINTIDQWTSAILVYGSLYLPSHTSEIAAFFKYIDFVRSMSKVCPSHAWLSYDEVFRRARCSSNLPWDKPLINQYVAAISQPRPQLFRNQQPMGRSPVKAAIPRGLCFSFNQTGSCNNSKCQFKHLCSICFEQHPKIKCQPKRGNFEKNNSKK